MIGFIDTMPDAAPHNGLFKLTLGDSTFILTPHAFAALVRRCSKAEAMGALQRMDAQERVIPLPKPTRRRKPAG